MNSFFVFCFCLVFVPTIIDGSGGSKNQSEDEWFDEIKLKLDGIAESGVKINNILKLTPSGYLGRGGYGLVYKGLTGVRASDAKLVAIKFVHIKEAESAEREYTMYTYLDAINKTDVERFGIPAVYYYGHWDDCILMALSLFEESLEARAHKIDLKQPLDNLIVFRQFVRQSKYLHSRGIRHDDIKPDNIMIRSYQCFLIDYNLSSKMGEDRYICSYLFKPRRCHRECQRFAMDDWESFFYTMCFLYEVDLKWLSNDEYFNSNSRIFDQNLGEAKEDIKDIRRKVRAIQPESMKACFRAFYNEIFGKRAKKFPDYDEIDRFITAQISELVAPNEPVFFTWMNENDTKAALKHMNKYRVPDIHNDIKEPSDIEFDTFTYPDVNFEYFQKTPDRPSSSRISLSAGISSLNKKFKKLKFKPSKKKESQMK